MGENKFTQGEWVAHGNGVHVRTSCVALAYAPKVDGVNDEVVANAKLIAASPDLLEACVSALDWINRFAGDAPIVFGGESELAEKLSAAIAKALTI